MFMQDLNPSTAVFIDEDFVDLYNVLAGVELSINAEDRAVIQNLFDSFAVERALHPDDDFDAIVDAVYEYIHNYVSDIKPSKGLRPEYVSNYEIVHNGQRVKVQDLSQEDAARYLQEHVALLNLHADPNLVQQHIASFTHQQLIEELILCIDHLKSIKGVQNVA